MIITAIIIYDIHDDDKVYDNDDVDLNNDDEYYDL